MLFKSLPSWKSITGFSLHQGIPIVLEIYLRGNGITPPVFVQVRNEVNTGRHGYYVGFNSQLSYEDLDDLKVVLEDMKVDGIDY